MVIAIRKHGDSKDTRMKKRIHRIEARGGGALKDYRLFELGDQWHFQERSHGMWFSLMPVSTTREEAMREGRDYVRAKRGWERARHASTCLVGRLDQ